MSHGRLASITLGAIVVILCLAGTGAAKTDPVVGCAAFKLKTVGATTSALLGCHAQAAQKGSAVDPECLGGAAGKLAAAFAKAEAVAKKAESACPTESDATATQADIDAFVASVVSALRTQSSASKCVAKKIASVGKYAQKLLGAHAANRLKADPGKFADKTAKAGAALAGLFAKLDGKGKDCQTSGDVAGMTTAAESLVVTRVCDDADLCTTDGIAGLVCLHSPITCAEHHACDFRTGACEYTDCCLMRSGATFCVVEIPVAQIPTSQAFCQGVDADNASLALLNVGPNCIGWRATGANDCF